MQANNTYSGGTTVSAGLLIASGYTSLSGPPTLSNGTVRVSPNVVSGFGGFYAGWTVNSTASITSTPITGDVLTLTDNALNEGRNAFYNTPESMGVGKQGFTASFVYTPSANKAANCAAFILQNDPRRRGHQRGTGGSLGYSGITPKRRHRAGTSSWPPAASVRPLGTNGSTPTYSSVLVSLGGGDPIKVTVAYDPADSILTETLLDTSTLATFTKS